MTMTIGGSSDLDGLQSERYTLHGFDRVSQGGKSTISPFGSYDGSSGRYGRDFPGGQQGGLVLSGADMGSRCSFYAYAV